MNSACGQRRSISRTKSNTIGRVRRVKNSPPGPPFSPRVWRMPYLRGTSQSSFQSRLRSMTVEWMTNPAPSSAARQSVVDSIFSPAPDLSLSSFASRSARASRSAFLPTSTRVLPARSWLENRSRNMLMPNEALVAPRKTILVTAVMFVSPSAELPAVQTGPVH